MNNEGDWPPKPLFSQTATTENTTTENTTAAADKTPLRFAIASLTVYGVAMLLWCGVVGIAISPLRSSVPPLVIGLAGLGAILLLFVSFGLAIPARHRTMGAVAMSLSGVGAFLSIVLVIACVIAFVSKTSGH